MPMSAEEYRFAMLDMRVRHAAIISLISDCDKQAMGFLQLYTALSGGALSGGVAIMLANAAGTPQRSLAVGLIGFAVPLIAGAISCLYAIWPSGIALPGLDVAWWRWAAETHWEHAYPAYLAETEKRIERAKKLNDRIANRMFAAKLLGAIAPVIGVCTGGIAFGIGS